MSSETLAPSLPREKVARVRYLAQRINGQWLKGRSHCFVLYTSCHGYYPPSLSLYLLLSLSICYLTSNTHTSLFFCITSLATIFRFPFLKVSSVAICSTSDPPAPCVCQCFTPSHLSRSPTQHTHTLCPYQFYRHEVYSDNISVQPFGRLTKKFMSFSPVWR